MFSYVRAAAFAVAAVGAALAPNFADPSLAWELEPAAAAPFDHAAANLDGGALEADTLEASEIFP
nr:hypothetical protein [Pseudomonadota bacterium]